MGETSLAAASFVLKIATDESQWSTLVLEACFLTFFLSCELFCQVTECMNLCRFELRIIFPLFSPEG